MFGLLDAENAGAKLASRINALLTAQKGTRGDSRGPPAEPQNLPTTAGLGTFRHSQAPPI